MELVYVLMIHPRSPPLKIEELDGVDENATEQQHPNHEHWTNDRKEFMFVTILTFDVCCHSLRPFLAYYCNEGISQVTVLGGH